MKRLLFLLTVALAGCTGNGDRSVDVTGQIEAVTVEAGSRVGGRISEVPVAEGDHVKQGDVLVRLESAEADALVAAAAARLAQTQAALVKLETGARPEEIRQAEAAALRAEEQFRLAEKGFRSQEVKAAAAAADAARAQRDEARAEFQRVEKLYREKVASQQRYDQAKHALEGAEAQYQAAGERQDLTSEGLRAEEVNMAKAAYEQAVAALDLLRNGARKEDIDAARALRDSAEADLNRARVTADEMVIKAPRDGVVESLDVHPGDLMKPGAIVSIVDPEDLELIVYVGAVMLGHLRVGQKVPLTTDAHGAETFEGTIARIASQGEFTPRNLQTKEERVQQVFGVKLKLNSAGGRLRAGMTATAHFPSPPESR
jgi:multidrug resistance efflux pump